METIGHALHGGSSNQVNDQNPFWLLQYKSISICILVNHCLKVL